MKKIVHVVAHSHWDREWYFTLEDSQVLLGENLKHLISVLENDKEFRSYAFDGQVSIIEDFIKYYPEYESRLKKLIRDKRIFIGPWYTQSDSLLVSIESIIRNLYYGINIANGLGHSMDIGYLPDIFGQNAYLPSIFKNFGITASIFQRGILNKELENGLNFIWLSPDNNFIFTNNIYLGYGPGKFLSNDKSYIENTLTPMLNKLSSFNKEDKHLLLPAGGDQVLVREHFPNTIKEINKTLTDFELVLSSYEDFIKASKDDIENRNSKINKVEGELRATEKSRIHRTIGSQRYDIKLLNSLVERNILNILEPLYAMSKLSSLDTIADKWFDDIWKSLFDCHSHDSIGSCNSDDTNRNILNRLISIERKVSSIINMLHKQFAYSFKSEKENSFFVWNYDIREYSGFINADVFSKDDFFVTDENNNVYQMQVIEKKYISGGKKIVVTAERETEIEVEGYYHYKVVLNVNIKPFSYKELFIKIGNDENVIKELKISDNNIIENKSYKISLSDGVLIYTNKSSNTIIKNPLNFEYSVDAGDSYDYSPDGISEPIYSIIKKCETKKSKYLECMYLEHEINVNNQLLIINTILEIRADNNTLIVKHSINNTLKNCRVRALWKTFNNSASYSYANQGFSLIKHPIEESAMKNWRELKYAEAPLPIYNMESILYFHDNKESMSCFTCGIKEYEILNKNTLALTMFRSVGKLGVDNLLIRPGRASGINNKEVETPDAFMLKNMTFEYGILIGEVYNSVSNVYREYYKYLNKISYYQVQNLNTFHNRLERFEIPLEHNKQKKLYSFTIDNKNIFSSMLKILDDNTLSLRLYNPSENNEIVKLLFGIEPREIYATDLINNNIRTISNNSIAIEKYSYITLKIIF